jgi:type IV secretion system protein VirB5
MGMKNLHVYAAGLLFSLLSFVAHAQIPTTDVAKIAQDAANQIANTGLIQANQAANIAKYAEQITELQNQLTQMKQEYGAITGSRNLGNIFNDPKYRDYLPSNWQGVYDSVRNGGYSGITGNAATTYNQNKVYDACQAISVDDQRTNCEARAVRSSQNAAVAEQAFDTAQGRIDQINQLSQQINQTSDPKAISELQARIAIEQAAMQNEQTKLTLYKMAADAQEQIEDQRAKEMHARTWAATGGVTVSPVTFSSGSSN